MRYDPAALRLGRRPARADGRSFPSETILGSDASSEARSGLAKLQVLATTEREVADRDRRLLQDLQQRAGTSATAERACRTASFKASTAHTGSVKPSRCSPTV